jgi:hypothetical protein
MNSQTFLLPHTKSLVFILLPLDLPLFSCGPTKMKEGNSDCKDGTTPKKTSWTTLVLLTSFIVLYILTAVFLFLQYQGLEDLKFRVAILEKERVVLGVGLSDEDLKSKVQYFFKKKKKDITFDLMFNEKIFSFFDILRKGVLLIVGMFT